MIAHRGASGYRPEHTRAAFALAVEQGADAVEPDLVPSRDGVLVIRHENEISQTTDVASRPEFAARRSTKLIEGAEVTGWFTEDFDWAELQTLRARERLLRIRPRNAAFDGTEPLLRFEDLLAMLDAERARQVRLVAELKHAAYFESIGLALEPLFLDTLDRCGWRDSPRVTVESFELTPLHRLAEEGLVTRMVYLLEASGAPADRPRQSYAEAMSDTGLDELAAAVDGISVDKRILLQDPDAAALVTRAHERGLLVYSWTLRPENRFLSPRFRALGRSAAFGDWRGEWEALMATGVDGVFADHPDLALDIRTERGRESDP